MTRSTDGMLSFTMRVIRKTLLVMGLVVLLIVVGKGGPQISAVDVAAAPYSYNLIKWEITHLPAKWWHKAWYTITRRTKDREERLALVREFFRIGEELAQLERARGEDDNPNSVETQGHSSSLEELRNRQRDLKAHVEEAAESEVSAVLAEEGLASWKGFIFPPVDVVFGGTPQVLTVSPRERIELAKTVLLNPDIDVTEMEALENKIFVEEELSALVVGIGGLATYPSIVSAQSGLLHATKTTTHEWLHQFLFFRPLGRNYWSTPEMTTLNETAVTLASEELADRVYEAITGEKLDKPLKKEEEEGAFSFGREMRQTRLRVEELLALGMVEEAESYMKRRRQLFLNRGYHIRKLNQAYFAFFSVYADNPASISPIHDELVRFRATTGSVGDFIRQIARFGSYPEFKISLERNADEPTVFP